MNFQQLYNRYDQLWKQSRGQGGFGSDNDSSREFASIMSTLDQYAQKGLVRIGQNNQYVPVGDMAGFPGVDQVTSNFAPGSLLLNNDAAAVAPPANLTNMLTGGNNASQLTNTLTAGNTGANANTGGAGAQSQTTTSASGADPWQGYTLSLAGSGGPNTVRVKMPDGSIQMFQGVTEALNQALMAGGTVLRANGSVADVRQFQGGWLVDNQPLNVLFGGQLTPEQQAALQAAGLGAGGTGGNGGVNTDTTTTDLINQLIREALALGNQAPEGLSEAAKAALTTQALEDVPGRFDEASQNLLTSLLRRGGAFPAGGEFLQGYGPLLAAREDTRAGLLRDVTLADEEARQKNRQFNIDAQLKALGLAGDLAGTRSQFDIAGLNADTQFKLAEFDADTRFQLAQMGIDSNERLAAADSALRLQLQQMGIDANAALARIDRDTRVELLKMTLNGDSTALRVAGSIASSALANPELIKSAIGWVKTAIGGGAAAAGAAGTAGAAGAGGAAAGGGAAASGGFGSTIAAFATNPATIAVAAAIAIGVAVIKSQAHWEANEMVQKFENPFASSFIYPMHQAFFQAAEAGKLSAEQAQSALQEFQAGWEEYQQKANSWAGNSSDKKLVATQSINNLKGLIANIIAGMNNTIQMGGYDRELGAA